MVSTGRARKLKGGEVPEWFKGTVLKTVVAHASPWVRIPPPPPFYKIRERNFTIKSKILNVRLKR